MGYCARLWQALLGRVEEAPGGLAAAPDEKLRSRLAALEMDLRERDARIKTMQAEYTRLEAARMAASSEGEAQLQQRLFTQLSNPLANVLALSDYAAAGQDVPAAEFVSALAALEKCLARAGLERLGKAGEAARFETRIHQPAAGSLKDGQEVTVQIPGFRTAERILVKAFVAERRA